MMSKASHTHQGIKKMTSLVRPPGSLQYREGVGDPARSLDNYDEKDERGDKSQDFQWNQVKFEVINPKSINENELYGNFDD